MLGPTQIEANHLFQIASGQKVLPLRDQSIGLAHCAFQILFLALVESGYDKV